MEAQIDSGAFHAAMTEEVANRFEWGPLLEQMHRQRMTETVRPAARRDTNTRPRRPGIESLAHGRRGDRSARDADAKKQPALPALPGLRAQVCRERGRHFIRERHGERRADLGPWDANH